MTYGGVRARFQERLLFDALFLAHLGGDKMKFRAEIRFRDSADLRPCGTGAGVQSASPGTFAFPFSIF